LTKEKSSNYAAHIIDMTEKCMHHIQRHQFKKKYSIAKSRVIIHSTAKHKRLSNGDKKYVVRKTVWLQVSM
jgi:hypothetical protein